ncbi:FkbM family methyltransferase [Candidatus Neomarinimicrobiota bacterium]
MLLTDSKAAWGFLTWPTFSFSSYSMVSQLERQGIEPKTVIDVGANIGQFSVASKKLFPDAHVYSFEPLPECIDKLRKNVSRLRDVTVFPVALGERVGPEQFHVNVHSHSSSILPLAPAHQEAFPEAKQAETISVETTTLDEVFPLLLLETPTLLKLDVQGYEANIILGGGEALKKIDYVLMETSFKPMYRGETLFLDLVALMQKYGFKFLRPIGWLAATKTLEVMQMDALFVRKDSPCALNDE